MINDKLEVKSVLSRATEGKINKIEFQQQLKPFLTEHNNNVSTRWECTVSEIVIDFGMSSKRPLPVLEKEDENSATAIVSITNFSKDKTLNWRFESVDDLKSSKYQIHIEPTSGKIKKAGKAQEVTMRIKVFCTTSVVQVAKLILSHRDSDTKEGKWPLLKKRDKEKRGSKEPDRTLEVTANTLFLAFCVESEPSLTIDYDEVELGELIAKGDHGVLYRALWRQNPVAVKVLDNHKFSEDEKEALKAQVRNVSKLNSSFVLTHYGTTLRVPGNPFCIVMEYNSWNSLKKVVETTRLTERMRWKIGLDVAKGLHALHSAYLAHRDVRMENILVISTSRDVAVNAKVANLGFYKKHVRPNVAQTNYETLSNVDNNNYSATLLKKESPKSTLENVVYYAPEMFIGEKEIDFKKADVYAFGILLFGLFANSDPAYEPSKRNLSPFEFAKHVVNGGRLEFPASFTNIQVHIIERCTDQDMTKRSEFPEIIKYLELHLPNLSDEQPISESPSVQVRGPSTSITSTVHSPSVPIPNIQNIQNTQSATNTVPISSSPTTNTTHTTHSTQSTHTTQSTPTTQPTYAQPTQVTHTTSHPSQPPINVQSNPLLNSSSNNLQSTPSNVTSSGMVSSSHSGIPRPSPANKRQPRDTLEVAWFGEISREQAENLLRGRVDGTFLTRWSSTTSSYVLSYVTSGGREFKHIAGILPTEESEAVTVVRVDSVVLTYRSLNEYVTSMQLARCIVNPLQLMNDSYAAVPIIR